jgi:arsenate reductase
MKYVLFVCTHNAGRSQIAQAFFERYAPEDVRAESAGQLPAEAIWPNVVEAMREVGIEIADRRPKKLDVEMQLHADFAITLNCAPSARMCRRRSKTGTSPTPTTSQSRKCA